MLQYRGWFAINPDTTLVGEVRSIVEQLQAIGEADYNQFSDKITFSVEGEDLWDLRALVEEVEVVILSYGIDFDIDKANVTTVPYEVAKG